MYLRVNLIIHYSLYKAGMKMAWIDCHQPDQIEIFHSYFRIVRLLF